MAVVDVGGPEARRLVIDEVQADTCHRLGAGNAEGTSHLLGDAPAEGKGLMVASAGKLAVRAEQDLCTRYVVSAAPPGTQGPVNADLDFSPAGAPR